jgi:hypothetical protein
MPENMVIDSSNGTNPYWAVIDYGPTQGSNGLQIRLAYSANPLGTWTLQTSALTGLPSNTGTNGDMAPCLVQDPSTNYWYIFANSGSYGSMTIYRYQLQNASGSPVTQISLATKVGSGVSTGISTVASTWKRGRVSECYIFQLQNAHGSYSANTWVMLYMGDGSSSQASGAAEGIGFATASSLTGSFTDQSSSGPIFGQGAANSWYYCGGATVNSYPQIGGDPYAVEVGGTIYIGFATARPLGSETDAINVEGYVTSTDLSTFTPRNILLGPDTTYAFGGAFRGAITLYNNTYYLTYCAVGNNSTYSTFQFAIASMSALNTAQGYPPDQVFGFYEGFSNLNNAHLFATPNPALTSSGYSASVSSNVLSLASGSGSGGAIFNLIGVTQFGTGYMAEAYMKIGSASSVNTGGLEFIGWPDEWSNNIQRYMVLGNDVYQTDTYWQQWVENSAQASIGQDMSQAYDGNYHTMQTYWQSSTVIQSRVDNNAWKSFTPSPNDIPNGTLSPSLSAYNTSTTSTTLSAEYLLVRPYSSPEPTTSVGSAQTQGSWLTEYYWWNNPYRQ